MKKSIIVILGLSFLSFGSFARSNGMGEMKGKKGKCNTEIITKNRATGAEGLPAAQAPAVKVGTDKDK